MHPVFISCTFIRNTWRSWRSASIIKLTYLVNLNLIKPNQNVSNKTFNLDNTDPTNLEALQALRNQLSAKYYKSQLDAFSLYVYGVVLSKLKLVDEAINILVESVKKRPTLWCAWLELANLIKTVETVIFNESHSFKSVVLFFLS